MCWPHPGTHACTDLPTPSECCRAAGYLFPSACLGGYKVEKAFGDGAYGGERARQTLGCPREGRGLLCAAAQGAIFSMLRRWGTQAGAASQACGQCQVPAGVGRGAYRGGAGRENVITRSSLLKVRHRLAGKSSVEGEGVTWGWSWGSRPGGCPGVSLGSLQRPSPRIWGSGTNTMETPVPRLATCR